MWRVSTLNISLQLSSHVTQNGCKLKEWEAGAPMQLGYQTTFKIARKLLSVLFDTVTHVKERAIKMSYKLQKHKGNVSHKHTSN